MIRSLRTFAVFLSLPVVLFARQATTPATNAAITSAPAAAAPITNPKTPQEFFARARHLSDLEAAGIPFHLKATYVASGDAEFTGNGTYEEWWQSKDLWRKEATLGDYKWVQIKNGGRSNLYATSAYIPLRLRQIVSAVEIQIAPEAGTESDWKIGHKKLGGVDVTVLSARYVPKKPGPVVIMKKNYDPQSVMKEDFFTSEGMLRVQQTGQIVTLYNHLQTFQNLVVPHTIQVGSGSQQLLNISVSALEPLNLKSMPDISSIPKNLFPVRQATKGAPTTAAPSILYAPPPSYPSDAEQEGMQGTVVINTMIDETGKTREPYVLVSAGPLLDKEALKTIREWRYRPAMEDGHPVAVDISISLTFAMWR